MSGVHPRTIRVVRDRIWDEFRGQRLERTPGLRWRGCDPLAFHVVRIACVLLRRESGLLDVVPQEGSQVRPLDQEEDDQKCQLGEKDQLLDFQNE